MLRSAALSRGEVASAEMQECGVKDFVLQVNLVLLIILTFLGKLAHIFKQGVKGRASQVQEFPSQKTMKTLHIILRQKATTLTSRPLRRNNLLFIPILRRKIFRGGKLTLWSALSVMALRKTRKTLTSPFPLVCLTPLTSIRLAYVLRLRIVRSNFQPKKLFVGNYSF